MKLFLILVAGFAFIIIWSILEHMTGMSKYKNKKQK